ncbi:uncharacterized protein BXZ73DRAFT_99903 [Epithele typhae]|uniref:uncharacterized protein n=1 Tax=Epithele typhae TaxID=378194 RepID=UPI0020085F25|nr:uncharacterized protein BXZ73DRAFT_99903 [Epithele typhae]KAH9938845.1 hypothetical protein BXZ73DRAFT_99903 [Epithele typhae]
MHAHIIVSRLPSSRLDFFPVPRTCPSPSFSSILLTLTLFLFLQRLGHHRGLKSTVKVVFAVLSPAILLVASLAVLVFELQPYLPHLSGASFFVYLWIQLRCVSCTARRIEAGLASVAATSERTAVGVNDLHFVLSALRAGSSRLNARRTKAETARREKDARLLAAAAAKLVEKRAEAARMREARRAAEAERARAEAEAESHAQSCAATRELLERTIRAGDEQAEYIRKLREGIARYKEEARTLRAKRDGGLHGYGDFGEFCVYGSRGDPPSHRILLGRLSLCVPLDTSAWSPRVGTTSSTLNTRCFGVSLNPERGRYAYILRAISTSDVHHA